MGTEKARADQKFKKQLKELGLNLSEMQHKQLYQYYGLLTEWNKVMNLTGITEYEEVNEKHFLDSLAIVKAVDFSKIKTVIDIGTGAGFPGIPLKIVFPWLRLTLLDSLNKRITFLKTVIQELGLADTEAIHGRAEDYARQERYREKYDLAVSRAVANLSTLNEYCIPYIRVGGIFVSYKSNDIEKEISDCDVSLKLLGSKLDHIYKFELPKTGISRSLIVVRKIKNTSNKYPRKAGLPAKEPLK